ncbi:odorant receptor 63a [Drosophila mojavensis]|uniref:Odorant receptor n=1 Tax=Drosophila mojavensis TaxID=7230 RepID=B4KX07_DROMO|nr:odorant receptor 63a [Drosophila mojavensis]EDW19650.1 uncharacterized protein Dmoj_GI11406 [Drosophila mojavensis]
MYSELEVKALEQRNYHRIREMIRVTYTMGYNIMKPGPWDNLLKFWSLLLILFTLLSYYGHWQLFVHYMQDIPRISESISTIFQSLMSIMKMIYYLMAPRRFYALLRLVCRHELLQKCELFAAVSDLPVAQPLKQRVANTMDQCWISTRRQLMFYLFCCIGILLNYFVNSLVVNIYHALTEPDNNYEVALPLPSLYPNWMDRGMTFPYYHLPLFLESCNLYICGMGAVSFDVLFIVFCTHGVGLMHSLTHMIEYATSPLIPRERRVQYLRHCIYQYQRVEAFALELNNTFRQIIIIQFILSLFCWGLVLFQISIGIATSLTIALRMLMYLAAGGYQIVIYCYNGQRFTTASERIPMAFYECTWYEESREFRQLIRMMIMRTNLSFSLDVSWFTKMSLPTLMSMIRASGQYTVLLQNLMQKK